MNYEYIHDVSKSGYVAMIVFWTTILFGIIAGTLISTINNKYIPCEYIFALIVIYALLKYIILLIIQCKLAGTKYYIKDSILEHNCNGTLYSINLTHNNIACHFHFNGKCVRNNIRIYSRLGRIIHALRFLFTGYTYYLKCNDVIIFMPIDIRHAKSIDGSKLDMLYDKITKILGMCSSCSGPADCEHAEQ